jgi:regulator of RNase E activity RraA
VDELRAARFPTYARGVFPAAMKGRLRIDTADQPAEIDGVVIRSGSYVVADSSGLVAFSPGRLREVLATAADLRRAEQDPLGDEADR